MQTRSAQSQEPRREGVPLDKIPHVDAGPTVLLVALASGLSRGGGGGNLALFLLSLKGIQKSHLIHLIVPPNVCPLI